MSEPGVQDHWNRFERWARRYRRVSAEFVAAHCDEEDWSDPAWLAFASECELSSPEAFELSGDLPTQIERRVQQKLQFLRAYFADISSDGAAFMSRNSRFLSCQYPSRCSAAWGFWFGQDIDGEIEAGASPIFQGFEAQLFLTAPADADFAAIRNVLPFDNLIVRRPHAELWCSASAKAVLAELKEDMEFDGYSCKTKMGARDSTLLSIDFRWT